MILTLPCEKELTQVARFFNLFSFKVERNWHNPNLRVVG